LKNISITPKTIHILLKKSQMILAFKLTESLGSLIFTKFKFIIQQIFFIAKSGFVMILRKKEGIIFLIHYS